MILTFGLFYTNLNQKHAKKEPICVPNDCFRLAPRLDLSIGTNQLHEA
jgi:hypothetical protein